MEIEAVDACSAVCTHIEALVPILEAEIAYHHKIFDSNVLASFYMTARAVIGLNSYLVEAVVYYGIRTALALYGKTLRIDYLKRTGNAVSAVWYK